MVKLPTTTKTNLQKIKTIIANPKNKTFLLSTHVNPDPDALGSELAMALFLKSKGKNVVVINHDDVPSRLKFLPYSDLVRSSKTLKSVEYDAAVVVDCGDLIRIGDVGKLLNAQKPIINIDHHITNDGFGTCPWVDPRASSTCEILFDLFESFKNPLSLSMAQLLYVGIMGDTGAFRYDNTSSKTHRIAAVLQEFDLSPADYYRKIYESIPAEDLQRFIRTMNRLQFSAGRKIVSLTFSEKLSKSFSEDFDLKESVFRFLRSIKDVEVSVIFTQVSRNKTRVNFRSAGRVDVAKIASQFKGGGHRNASGCTVDASAQDVRRKVLKVIEKACR